MSNCLTQAQFVQKESSMGLITTSTDGHFTFWDLTPVLDPFYTITPSTLSLKQPITAMETPAIISCESRYQIHSNNIKSVELAQVSDSTSLIVAGGDDNALTFSLLDTALTNSGFGDTRVQTVTIPDAHTASVTTIKIIEHNSSHVEGEGADAMVDLTVASSGNDHRVKVWSVQVNMAKDGVDAIQVGNLVDHYSPVADISSLDVVRGEMEKEVKLLVCGVGMEMVKVR